MSRYHREQRTFEPDSIRDALTQNMSEALRAIADAIDSGDLKGERIRCIVNGLYPADTVAVAVMFTLLTRPASAQQVPTLPLPVSTPTEIQPMEPQGGQQQ